MFESVPILRSTHNDTLKELADPMTAATATETATLSVNGRTLELPVITVTEREKALDIRKLRDATGCITLDPGFGNTGACTSGITFLDGERGILRYRGFPIEQLAESAPFMETAYLLIGLWTYRGTARQIGDGNTKTFRFITDAGSTPIPSRDFVTLPVSPSITTD